MLTRSFATESADMGYKEDLQNLAEKIDSLKRPTVSGWQKASPLIAASALLFAGWNWWTTHSSGDMKNAITVEVGSQLKGPIERLNDTASDVRAIKEYLSLSGLHAFLDLPKDRSAEGIPQLRRSLQLASTTHETIPEPLVRDTSQRLLQVNSTAPGLWPAAAELISYRSSMEARKAGPSILLSASSSLPNCTDSLPSPARVTQVIDPLHINVRFCFIRELSLYA